MARIRRIVVGTYRMSTRHTETPTKKLCSKSLREMRDSIITRAFSERGIALSPEDIEARGFRISTPREYCHGLEVIGYEYDITARV